VEIADLLKQEPLQHEPDTQQEVEQQHQSV